MRAYIFVTSLLAIWYVRSCNGDKWIVKNEDHLIGTCTKTCGSIGGISNKFGCQQITKCHKNSRGWTRGWVRCDYCKCLCKEPTSGYSQYRKTTLYTMEHELYGTCTRSGCGGGDPVRTNFKGCQLVRNCINTPGGWTRGFVYCDKCKCDCLNPKRINKYRLENVQWDLGRASYSFSSKLSLGHATAENPSRHPQKVSQTISFKEVKTSSWSNSFSLALGHNVEVSAGIPEVVNTKVTISRTLTFTTQLGKSKSLWKTHSVTASAVVQPKSKKVLTIVGERYRMSVPYTGDLVTVYADGTKSRKKTSGIVRDAGVTKFRIRYGKDIPL